MVSAADMQHRQNCKQEKFDATLNAGELSNLAAECNILQTEGRLT
jgi:hypothetical protein